MLEALSWPLLTSVVRKLRDTDVSLYVLSVSPLGLPGLEGKPFSAFKCTYGALYKALNEIPPRSTAWLLARLNKPEPFVDASGGVGGDGRRMRVLQCCLVRGGISRM